MHTTTPLNAATVILTRESSQGQFKLFLMRRHRDQNFMGGVFVFPGGRLDEEDCDPELALCAQGLTGSMAKERLQESDLTEETALGLFFAAVRETFEEAGVLLAYNTSGKVIDFSQGETAGRFAPYRLKLHERKITLKELAKEEHILYALDLLIPYSHWITPEIESRRFNTRFFLAHHPMDQFPFHDSIETTKSLWLTPASALGSYQSGDILLMPPTLKTLEELNRFHSSHELFAATASKRIDTILPQGYITEDGFGVMLPHDPEYAIDLYKQPPRSDEPSRIVMKDKKWRLVKLTDQE